MVVYRGGDNAYVTNKDLITKAGPNQGKYGLSVSADKAAAATHGAPRQLMSLPKGYKLIHAPSSADPFHCLIVSNDIISKSQFNKFITIELFGPPLG